jgi:hypothetical protein
MKVRFLKDGESPEFGVFKKGDVKDLDPSIERVLIKRGIAENVSAPDYIVKSKRTRKK